MECQIAAAEKNCTYVVAPKSLYISRAGRHLMDWAGFGLVGSTENCSTKPIISYFGSHFYRQKKWNINC